MRHKSTVLARVSRVLDISFPVSGEEQTSVSCCGIYSCHGMFECAVGLLSWDETTDVVRGAMWDSWVPVSDRQLIVVLAC